MELKQARQVKPIDFWQRYKGRIVEIAAFLIKYARTVTNVKKRERERRRRNQF